MVNLIGTELNQQWLSLPLVHLHWYEKDVRPVRKVGHLNLTHSCPTELADSLNSLVELLPNEYKSGIDWAKEKLNWYYSQ